jgi:multisubunit Na+/H+ antiporter MnhG subunit
MGVDIRIPIGLMFTILGLLLAVFGLLSDSSIYQRSLGINVNLLWGAVLTVFGVIMLWMGRRRSAG